MAVDPQLLNAVRVASVKHGVPASLLAAQIQAESGWNPNAKSPAGAVGISQFMPATAKGFGIDPHNPMQSIDAQARMMSNLLHKFGGNVDKALAGYNAGAGAVEKYGGVPPFKETQSYIKNIKSYQKNYPGLAKGDKLPLPSGASVDSPFAAPDSPIKSPPPGSSAVAGPGIPFLTPGALLQAAKAHVSQTQADQGVSFIEQAFGQAKTSGPDLNPLTNAPLPSGGFATVQVHALKVQPGLDPKLAPSSQGIVQAALKFKGTPYSWGGGGASGPTTGIGRGAKTKGFDCSGLVQYAVFQATGKKIPRVASAQLAAATPVDQAHAKPGDVIGFGSKSNVHHIGIYLGDGKFIEAPHTGAYVQVSSLSGRKDIVGFGRY